MTLSGLVPCKHSNGHTVLALGLAAVGGGWQYRDVTSELIASPQTIIRAFFCNQLGFLASFVYRGHALSLERLVPSRLFNEAPHDASL
jgi:hypothetical protein